MKFALHEYYNPAEAGPTEGEVADWMAFDEAVKAAEAHVDEAGFQPAFTARTISVRDGETVVDDGPVIDTGDIIASFWVIDVPDSDAAVEWAQQIPTATYGKVEVRPIVEL